MVALFTVIANNYVSGCGAKIVLELDAHIVVKLSGAMKHMLIDCF